MVGDLYRVTASPGDATSSGVGMTGAFQVLPIGVLTVCYPGLP
jgi:hypothetical protein